MRDKINKDLWNAIKDNYEKESYTTAITNAMIYINEVVQEKSELEGLDNTKLMDQAFLGKSPKLLVNQNQTQTEKDIQQGVGFILKGMCLSIRNPRSHERYKDTKKNADEIIFFINYILSLLHDNVSPYLVEDWVEFILDKHFNCDKKNANDVITNIPDKKKYDVLTGILRNREVIDNDKDLTHILCLLYLGISKEQNEELVNSFNKELTKIDINEKLYSFFKVYPCTRWSELDVIVRNRIQGMVLKSIENASATYEEMPYGGWALNGYNEEAELAIHAEPFIEYFENKDTILKELIFKLFSSQDSSSFDFVKEYYLASLKKFSLEALEKEICHVHSYKTIERDSETHKLLCDILSIDIAEKFIDENFVAEEDEFPY